MEFMKTERRNSLVKHSAIVLAIAGVIGFGLGCAEESPKKVPLQVGKVERVKDQSQTTVSFQRSVDVLFVIDDSGSMAEHQANLAKNVRLFTQAILANQILDYHIGVVTSNMTDRPWSTSSGETYRGELWGLTKYVTRLTKNGQAILEKNLQPGTDGSASEMFFSPVQAALTPPLVNGANKGFYRPDAHLAVIFLTDSDDQSPLSPADFYKFLLGLKGGDASKIMIYGANIPTTDKMCSRSGEPEPKKLEALYAIAKVTPTQTLGLCDVDFGLKLADLGNDLVRRIGNLLFLSRPAQPHTIKVTFGSQTIPNDPKTGWVYDPVRNALLFGDDIDLKEEPPGTQIEVDFIAAEY